MGLWDRACVMLLHEDKDEEQWQICENHVYLHFIPRVIYKQNSSKLPHAEVLSLYR